jgi:hypothetical protein
MEEAVEICKLRLFLKLVAQAERADELEPLPDIDFNIRAGNTLVGFTSIEEVKRSMKGDLFKERELPRIDESAEIADRAFEQFRRQQTEFGGAVTVNDKLELRRQLSALDTELDRYLASEYGVDLDKPAKFEAWRKSHQPFHWFVEFYGIMKSGGFDVVIGNPPYVVYSADKVGYEVRSQDYRTFSTKNLYALVFERSIKLAGRASPIGLIVQLTAVSSERLPPLQDLLMGRGTLHGVPFPRRPESVFEGVEMPVVILISRPWPNRTLVTCRVNRFYTEERVNAMETLQLVLHDVRLHGHRIAKFGSELEKSILSKIARNKETVDGLTTEGTEWLVFYQEACRYWLKSFNRLPFFTRNGRRIEPPHGRILRFKSDEAACFVTCLLNSSLFYWYYSAFSDCEHVNDDLIRTFPVPRNIADGRWRRLANQLMKRLEETATRKTIKTKQGHTIQYDEMKALNAKGIIDEIDVMLASAYDLKEAEYEFLRNYDLKYRMGQEGEDAEEE